MRLLGGGSQTLQEPSRGRSRRTVQARVLLGSRAKRREYFRFEIGVGQPFDSVSQQRRGLGSKGARTIRFERDLVIQARGEQNIPHFTGAAGQRPWRGVFLAELEMRLV